MGCSASKHQFGRDERNAPLVRSMSLPGSGAKIAGGSPSKCPWKSNNRGNGMGSVDVCTGHLVGTLQGRSSKLKPVKEEDVTLMAMTPNQHSNGQASVCMDDFSQRRNASRKYVHANRTASFGCAHEDSAHRRVSSSGKVAGNENEGRNLKSVDNLFICTDSRACSFRVMESMDGNSGLRLLLSPATTPSRSFTSSTRSGTLSKTLSSSDQSALNSNSDSPRVQAVQNCKALPIPMEGMGDSEEPGSPLFDPSILATFEKAVVAASDDNWQSSDVTSSSSSRVGGCSSSDTCSDAESLDWPKENGIYQGAQKHSVTPVARTEDKVDSDVFRRKSDGNYKKKLLSVKVAPVLNDAWAKKDYLEGFDVKCPHGCEDKIVLYFTSLRGIRKTYEDCCTVRLILKGYGVHVDERDVWMHFTFRQELTNVVGAVLTVPRLFVKGRYIGGVEDVKYLHEEGILGDLLEGLPAESNSMCDMCGGVRFIPCTSCSGSCKLISSREVSRCPDCNENGLMLCPSCYW